jgi:GNAT superfamily N-acetyltransferase
LTLTALDLPRPGAALAPASVEAWLAHSALNNAAAWDLSPRRMERRRRCWDDVWAADPGLANPFPNSATLLRPMTEASAQGVIDRLNAFYDAGPGGPWMLWSPWPTPELRPHGFELMGHPPLMIRQPGGIDRLTPPELEIVEVGDAALADWQHVLVEGYPAPELRDANAPFLDERILGDRLRLWVGYVAGRPVACAGAYVDGAAIGLTSIATLPDARGRGYGAALTHRAATCVPTLPSMLNSSDLGRPVYERLGFVTIARYTLWVKTRRHDGSGPRLMGLLD